MELQENKHKHLLTFQMLHIGFNKGADKQAKVNGTFFAGLNSEKGQESLQESIKC